MKNRKILRKASVLFLSTALVVGNLSVPAYATELEAVLANSTDDLSDDTTDIIVDDIIDGTATTSSIDEVKTIALNMGVNKSEISFTWFATSANDSFVKVIAPNGTETQVAATQNATYYDALGYYSYSATLSCFDVEGDYIYQVGNDDQWSDADTLYINDATDNEYSFLVAGDPQIGSGGAESDGDGWENTLDLATAWFGDSIDFLLSVGDQVNASSKDYAEGEYDEYFSPSLLSSIPSLVSAGNHEAYTYSTYSAHFTSPSTLDTSTASATTAGDESGDYWLAYEGTLFISLNSNIYSSSAFHYDFIKNAIDEYTALYGEPTWQIVTFHHSIYSTASHYNDTDIQARRNEWADIFSEFNIDVVLMGHDHVYTRSVMMQGMIPTDYADNSNEEVSDYVVDPSEGEVLYITANSASGSKYYPIQNYELDYVAVKDQTNTPTITKVDVSDDALTITTYYTGEGNTEDDVVDEFTIVRNETEYSNDKEEVTESTYDDIHTPTLTVPEDSTVYVGDDYDVMEGVSATDYNYVSASTEDVTSDVVAVGDVDTTTVGVYKVNYYVSDGTNVVAASVTVTVKEGLTLIDGDTVWTSTDGGYEATFTFDDYVSDYESIIGTYTTNGDTTISINGIVVDSYTVQGRASVMTRTFTISGDDLDNIYGSTLARTSTSNTITVTTTYDDFELTSMVAEKSFDASSFMDYTFYPAIAADSVEGEYNDEEDTILNVDTISGFSIGGSDEDGGLVEIVSYNSEAEVAYVSSGSSDEIIAIPMNSLTTAGLYGYGYNMAEIVNELVYFSYGDISSVAVSSDGKYLAVAVQHETYTENGVVLIFELDESGKLLANPEVVECGVQPDALTFTPDASKILVANEGEPREGYSDDAVDPEGSVTIINVANFSSSTVNFKGVYYDDEVLLKSGSTPSEDFEPEYIATTNTVAYVALQENNAIAVLDLTTETFTGVYGLGLIDYSEVAIDIVADEIVNDTTTYDNLYGIRMPDGISIYEMDGTTYLYTANEGDGREWGDGDSEYVNEEKSKTSLTGNIVLDEKVTWFVPTDYEMLDQDADYLFGGRSFSIYEVTDSGLELVFDSYNDFSDIVAETYAEWYNCSNDDSSVEDRAGKKGVEPEYTVVGEVDGQIYAFTGLERQGGIMIYNVTDPTNVSFVNYINSRDYSSDIAGDVAPEGLAFVSAADSTTGNALLLVANEVSGTMSVIELTENTLYVAPTVNDGNGSTDNESGEDTTTGDNDDSDETNSDIEIEDAQDSTSSDDLIETGDDTNMSLYLILMFACAGGVLVALRYKKSIKKHMK